MSVQRIVNYTNDTLSRLSPINDTNNWETSYGHNNVGNVVTHRCGHARVFAIHIILCRDRLMPLRFGPNHSVLFGPQPLR